MRLEFRSENAIIEESNEMCKSSVCVNLLRKQCEAGGGDHECSGTESGTERAKAKTTLADEAMVVMRT